MSDDFENLEELAATAALVRAAAPPFDTPPDLASRVHAAVIALDDEEPTPFRATRPGPVKTPRWSWPRRLMLANGLAIAAIAAVVVALQVGGGKDGVVEVSGDLTAADGATVAAVEVREIGIGRIVDLESDELPILPKGEFYEVWFVGPGDSAGSPNRISAGTFHPNPDGRSDLELKAAVDPSLFPRIEITAEPGDGDPAPSGTVVAELDS